MRPYLCRPEHHQIGRVLEPWPEIPHSTGKVQPQQLVQVRFSRQVQLVVTTAGRRDEEDLRLKKVLEAQEAPQGGYVHFGCAHDDLVVYFLQQFCSFEKFERLNS